MIAHHRARRCFLVLLVLIGSCAAKVDDSLLQNERREIESTICASRTVAEAEAKLAALHIEYSMGPDRSELVAIKHYDSRQGVSAAIAIKLTQRSGQIDSCEVRLVYTGP